jgi:hypothetical protein
VKPNTQSGLFSLSLDGTGSGLFLLDKAEAVEFKLPSTPDTPGTPGTANPLLPQSQSHPGKVTVRQNTCYAKVTPVSSLNFPLKGASSNSLPTSLNSVEIPRSGTLKFYFDSLWFRFDREFPKVLQSALLPASLSPVSHCLSAHTSGSVSLNSLNMLILGFDFFYTWVLQFKNCANLSIS